MTKFCKRHAETLLYLGMAVIAMIGFLFLGEPGYYLIDDSESYMSLASGMEGVMPVYPFFLHGNKLLFGEDSYLNVVIVEQSLFAAVCVIILIRTLKKRFGLNGLESVICFFLALLTFTADLPETMVTREILTEGLAYAAFYLFMAALLETVWRKSWKWYGILCATTLFLSAIRSQLQILFGVCGIACIYIIVCRGMKAAKRRMPLRMLGAVAGCLLTGLAGIWMTAQIAGNYRVMTLRLRSEQGAPVVQTQQETPEQQAETAQQETPEQQAEALQQKASEQQMEEAAQQETLGQQVGAAQQETPEQQAEAAQQKASEQQMEEAAQQEASEQQAETAQQTAPVQEAGRVRQKVTTSQYISLIFNKGMYEADYEDYQLFADGQVRELFLRLYDRVDREQYRYEYATPGLWMWKDIMDSALIGVVCIQEQDDFYLAQYPELLYDSSYSYVRNHNQIEIGLTLIKAHWGRFLYHTLMLLPQAFVSTVFFQMKRIYLLCHIITLFLYLSAIALTVWAYRNKRVQNAYGEFMAAVLCTNVVMVVVVSVVFFGQKRYMFYNFGIFYISYFLLLLQIWKQYAKSFVTGIIEKHKRIRADRK